MPANVSNGYFDTLDLMVVLVINSADMVILAQLLLLTVEGVVVCALAVMYMALLTRQVAAYRYNGKPQDGYACVRMGWVVR